MSSTDNKSCRAPPHVAFLPLPIGSHTSALFTVAKALALAAPTATFSFISSSESVASLSSASIANLRLVPTLDASTAGTVDEQLSSFVRAMPGNLRAAVKAAVAREEGSRLSCILSDGLMPETTVVAREMGVPWIPVRFCGPAMSISLFHTYELREAFGSAAEEARDELISFIPSLSALRVRDLPDFMISGSLDHMVDGIIEEYPKAAALVFNTMEGLEPLVDAEFKSKSNRYLTIGPTKLLFSEQSTGALDPCVAWLDRQRAASVVYISFGTFNTPTRPELAEIAQALEGSGYPFLWSIKSGCLPSGFAEGTNGRGMVVDWAPQVEVLRHQAVGAFVTHGGWNSVMESTVGGVPTVCRPFRWDQMMNARMASEVHGTGVMLDGVSPVTKEGMAVALRLLMEEDGGAKMRARAKTLRAQAEQAVAPGGSSSENFKSLLDIVCS